MNGSYDPYPDFSPSYEPTSFSWWLFSLNGNFSNKIDQVLMAISCYLNSAFSIRSTDGPDSLGWR